MAQEDLDSIKVDPAHHKVEFENDQIRVVRWVVSPGDKTAKHSHPASLIVLLTDYDARVTSADGKSIEAHYKAGSAMWREALTHVVENVSPHPMEGIIVEPKKAALPRPAPTQGPA
jgi:quercetin dioxygenase-like cupin family protein